jgi:hypothetical protein
MKVLGFPSSKLCILVCQSSVGRAAVSRRWLVRPLFTLTWRIPEDIAGATTRLTEDGILREQLMANGERQLQTFILKAEIEKLTRVFEKSTDAEFRPTVLEDLPRRLAILFLDLLYATSALYESILGGFRRK